MGVLCIHLFASNALQLDGCFRNRFTRGISCDNFL